MGERKRSDYLLWGRKTKGVGSKNVKTQGQSQKIQSMHHTLKKCYILVLLWLVSFLIIVEREYPRNIPL